MKKNIKSPYLIRFLAITSTFIVMTFLTFSVLSVFASKAQTRNLNPHNESVTSIDSKSESDPKLISNSKQLTFVGPRSGEGYFSHDGKKMIFQSEREPGNPFYQIYVMDLLSGKIERVSPGKGKTTCAWIHPDGQRVMFSSTHLDKEIEQKVKEEYESRKSVQKMKYSWSYDPNFAIFEFDQRSKKLTQLTHEYGYNAEGSYSPNGKHILFASNRVGYTDKLSDEDAKIFKQDPSYMMDLYVMDSSGKNVKRLTNMKGYNGGPFYSADGKKITWRHFAPNGQTAEIWTMNSDGSDQKAITKIGAMSWAPYFHPSGDYIIFTSNILGYSNFELFIIDTEGKHEPVRVSYLPDFDGLPVFSPDGKKLSWTHRNEKGESQILIADWNDQKARDLLGLQLKAPRMADLSSEMQPEDSKKIIQYLASDYLAGRATGSLEEQKYTIEIMNLFKEMGLRPIDEKGYIQAFEFATGVALGEKNGLVIKTQDGELKPKLSEDFIPLSFSKNGEFSEAPIAFAGYGIVAPASDKQPMYDSYKGLDVKGKWVLVFRDIPENIPNEKRIHLNMYSRLHHKSLVASQRGAEGLLVMSGPNSQSKQKIVRLKFDGNAGTTALPVISITDDLAEKIVQSSGRSLKKWQDILDMGEIQNTEINKVSVSANVDLNLIKSLGHNVVGQLEVPGAKTSIVIGAHGDHLGRGNMGNSLAKPDEQGKPHYGADDNASGVSGVLMTARHYSELKRKNKIKNLKQNIIFAVWSGEEIGVIGSSHFVRHTKQKITANLNMDMIGRLKENLLVQGVASAHEWKNLIEKISHRSEISLVTQEDPYLPTDSMAFYMESIPAISFFTGAHGEYHSPRDTANLINYIGLSQVVRLVSDMAAELASTEKSGLTYQKVEGSKNKLEGRTFRIYLGTIPDYSQDGVKGVRISGATKESPADKAGLRAGDIIVEVAGTKIENLYDYVYCLQSMKANQTTSIKVNRQGKIEDLSIVPVLKE